MFLHPCKMNTMRPDKVTKHAMLGYFLFSTQNSGKESIYVENEQPQFPIEWLQVPGPRVLHFGPSLEKFRIHHFESRGN